VIILDRALERRERAGRPIRVGMVGAGFMGRGIALQITTAIPGMDLVAVSNRHLDGATRAFKEAGIQEVQVVDSAAELDDAVAHGRRAVTADPLNLCNAESVDAVIEVTGTVELGARVALRAIERGKHVVLMNAELDGTVGPILKTHADRAGVVFTNSDGDQPGVTMNLYRFVLGLGLNPVLCGNIKGLHDPYRNPTTQQEFARRWKQQPQMVTSFADGTKISFEQAIVANATGMRVGKRGMYGPTVPTGTSVVEAADWYPHDELVAGKGIVDYVVGAAPSPGVFVLATQDHPVQRHYLELYKLGRGPFYCFYAPYHLCHFEAPYTVARAVLFEDAAIAPLGPPLVDVIATAKTDLRVGQTLDGLGGYTTYGQCENAELVRVEGLLPIGLAEGATLRRDVSRDRVLTYSDVDLPEGRLCDQLRAEQDSHFAPTQRSAGLSVAH
jgi:predicted homoserine dehydrogenase-like protein